MSERVGPVIERSRGSAGGRGVPTRIRRHGRSVLLGGTEGDRAVRQVHVVAPMVAEMNRREHQRTERPGEDGEERRELTSGLEAPVMGLGLHG